MRYVVFNPAQHLVLTGAYCCAGTGGQAPESTNICKCLARIAPVIVGGPSNSLRPSPFDGATETTTANVQGCTGTELEPHMCQIRVQTGSPAGLPAATAAKVCGQLHRDEPECGVR